MTKCLAISPRRWVGTASTWCRLSGRQKCWQRDAPTCCNCWAGRRTDAWRRGCPPLLRALQARRAPRPSAHPLHTPSRYRLVIPHTDGPAAARETGARAPSGISTLILRPSSDRKTKYIMPHFINSYVTKAKRLFSSLHRVINRT